jgi:pyruvate/2-oxoglutarate dehydrogenase complex dihydrolipoamide acyltransferase (E2) component
MRGKFRVFYIGALAVTGVGLLATSFVPKAHGDAWDKMTIVTVNQPIIAGDKVLQPGTYVWKLLDSQSNRHVVQIFDKNQDRLETTILAIPDYRLQPTGHSQFAFWETPAGVPKAVRAWFYPGDNFGQAFPYPKKLVAQLASAAPTPIPTAYKEPEPASAPVAEPAPEPASAPPPAAAPQPEPPPAAPPAEPAPAPVAQQPAALPHTASLNPLIALIGAGCLGLAGLLSLAGASGSQKV